MESGNETILFVDDDVQVVSALQRSLHRAYEVEIACSGADALEAVEGHSYAVVVSDVRMPGISGLELLAKVKEISPETVRILLTGHADVETAIDAVNDGNIFRLLTKPCPQNVLVRALDAALTQYRLVTAESAVLRETLNGTIELLVDILGTVQPLTLTHSSRLLRYTRALGSHLGITDTWELEAAALLAQLGCLSLPADVLNAYYTFKDLDGSDSALFTAHPHIARKLLGKVPKLARVADIIARQLDVYSADAQLAPDEYQVALLGEVLRAALEIDRDYGAAGSTEAALAEMGWTDPRYHPRVQAALDALYEEVKGSPGWDQSLAEPPHLDSDSAVFRPLTEQVLHALRR
jgi:response regulator RpfG family c-di-GMP phosphodiesterase